MCLTVVCCIVMCYIVLYCEVVLRLERLRSTKRYLRRGRSAVELCSGATG